MVDHRDVVHRMAPSISELWGLITINPGAVKCDLEERASEENRVFGIRAK